MPLLTLPPHLLDFCISRTQELPHDQHRAFLDAVAARIDPKSPDDVGPEVISQCALVLWYMQGCPTREGEYLSEWRSDVEDLIARDLFEACVEEEGAA